VAIILPRITAEFNPTIDGGKASVAFTTFALYMGLIVGASLWGLLADVIGRRLSWLITLFLAGIFGTAAGGALDFVALGALVACTGFGIGGNLPVDGALYLECETATPGILSQA
jgi:MFS family permease